MSEPPSLGDQAVFEEIWRTLLGNDAGLYFVGRKLDTHWPTEGQLPEHVYDELTKRSWIAANFYRKVYGLRREIVFVAWHVRTRRITVKDVRDANSPIMTYDQYGVEL